jgi:hypothetical protein
MGYHFFVIGSAACGYLAARSLWAGLGRAAPFSVGEIQNFGAHGYAAFGSAIASSDSASTSAETARQSILTETTRREPFLVRST